MSSRVLYMTIVSPPVRAVILIAKTLGVEMEWKNIDIFGGENLTPEYIKMNPQHTIPTLVDGDFVIWDSHAIMIYLIDKYGEDDSLYPKDPEKRAIVNQRLHFHSGILFPPLLATFRPILYERKKEIPEEKANLVRKAYKFLEAFLDDKEWVAGDFLSIADYSLFTSVTTINILVPVEEERYPNISAWLKRCEDLPYYDISKAGVQELADLVESTLNN